MESELDKALRVAMEMLPPATAAALADAVQAERLMLAEVSAQCAANARMTEQAWAERDAARADVGAMQAELAAMGARNLATSYDRDAQIAEVRASLAAARDVLRDAVEALDHVGDYSGAKGACASPWCNGVHEQGLCEGDVRGWEHVNAIRERAARALGAEGGETP